MPRENVIHPTAIIGTNVSMGEGNWIGPYCVISGDTRIGSGNRFRSHAVIGTPPEKHGYFFSQGETIIGDNCFFSEHTTVHAGSDKVTYIGSNVVILRGAHVGHDAVIYESVTLSCNVLIGGHAIVMKHANLGLGAVVHQHQVIGSYAMVGMNSTVTKTSYIKPGGTYAGSPAKLLGQNVIGLKRAGDVSLPKEIEHYRELLKRQGIR